MSKIVEVELLRAILIIVLAAALLVFINSRFSSPSSESRNQYGNQPEVPVFIKKAFRITAYCSCEKCCGEWADGITACGYKIQKGDKLIAASKQYPFGTVMDVPDYGEAQVLDRGGVIKGSHLDVFFPTHREALEWGIRYRMVKVYESENKIKGGKNK